MKGVRFYLEFPSTYAKRRGGPHKGTVLAVEVHEPGGMPRWRLGTTSSMTVDCLGGIFDKPDSSVTPTDADQGYLASYCKRISEQKAREIHPRLFKYLDWQPPE